MYLPSVLSGSENKLGGPSYLPSAWGARPAGHALISQTDEVRKKQETEMDISQGKAGSRLTGLQSFPARGAEGNLTPLDTCFPIFRPLCAVRQ